MALFNVRLSDDLATRFDAWAAARGGRSAALRKLMGDASAAERKDGDAPAPRQLRPLKLTVRLSATDAAGLADEAAAVGLTPNSWASALIRHRLHGRPTFARPDHLVLIAAQAELRRVGVNVNQIARALNTAVIEGRVLELELASLEDLRTELHAHMSTIRSAFEGAHAYWSCEP